MRRIVWLAAVLALSCAKDPTKNASPEPIGTALAPYVLDGVPSDIKHPVFIDFESKVHLIGYDIDPDGVIGPGSKAKLKLYWKCVSPLGPGWRLYTHLTDPHGRVMKNLTGVGPDQLTAAPLRGEELTPSKWEVGKVYVDEVEFEVPRDMRLPEFTIAAGLWRPMPARGDQPGRDDIRLDPISGPSDSEHRALVAHVKTGVVYKPAPAASAAGAQRTPPPKS